MSEVREKLKPYLDKRVQVRGTFCKWVADWTRNNRQVGRACITAPEVNGEVVAQYVWVTDVPHWKEYKDRVGDQVEFDAVVRRYAKGEGETNYCLGNASCLTFLHEPPAMRIPAEVIPNETVPTQNELEAPVETDSLKDLRQAIAFSKVCGNPAKALETLKALPPISIPTLIEYLIVLLPAAQPMNRSERSLTLKIYE